MAPETFLNLPELGQSLELVWVRPEAGLSDAGHGNHDGRSKPTLVFLHEGLGSPAQWRGFPQALCNATGLPGLMYARQGYGRSSLRRQAATPAFMHEEARLSLPALLGALGIGAPILVGHSDGASISLIYAGSDIASAPAPLGLCVMAPHLFVEEEGLASIAQARDLFDSDASFRDRLGRYHQDVRHTFDNWAGVWLSEDFKSWDIGPQVARIRCPVLAIQGRQDQYGSIAQIRRIRSLIPLSTRVDLLEIEDCKHSPHLEKPAEVLKACEQFIASLASPSHARQPQAHQND